MSTAGLRSLLHADGVPPLVAAQPYFADLSLDRVLAAVDGGGALQPVFATPVDRRSIALRHSVFRELDANAAVLAAIEVFRADVVATRELIDRAARVHSRGEHCGWHLAACERYLAAVHGLVARLIAAQPQSAALAELTGWLSIHLTAPAHTAMRSGAAALRATLDGLRFAVVVDRDHVSVRPAADEADFSELTRRVLARFVVDEPPSDPFPSRLVRPSSSTGEADHTTPRPELNPVESQILGGVARLFPDEFDALEQFCAATDPVIDPAVAQLETELSFFLSYRTFMASATAGGAAVRFCYPEIADDTDATTWIEGGLDLTLVRAHPAGEADPEQPSEPLVDNDFRCEPGHWAVVVTGPNQAGKTTYARMVGQVHHLAAIGVPVPARRARLRPVSSIHTHFEQAQTATSARGRLADELARLATIVRAADRGSVVILNDTFASTSLRDARTLSAAVLDLLRDRCAVCVYVSVVRVAADGVVDRVGEVPDDDPSTRTYRIVPAGAEPVAYADAVAAKYRLTYADVIGRLGR